MHEATFHLTPPSSRSYDSITAQFGGHLSLWCTDSRDLVVVHLEDDTPIDPLLEAIETFTGIDDSLVDTHSSTALVVTTTCVKSHETPVVDGILDDHGCLLLPPIRYHDGGRSIRVLSLEPAALTACYRALAAMFDVTVESKRELSTASFNPAIEPGTAPEPGLSPQQHAVLSLAIDRGYYEIPRATSMAAIADSLDIDRRTADEHRRRAEKKCLEWVRPFLESAHARR